MSQELKEKTSQQQELAIDIFKNHFYGFTLLKKQFYGVHYNDAILQEKKT